MLALFRRRVGRDGEIGVEDLVKERRVVEARWV